MTAGDTVDPDWNPARRLVTAQQAAESVDRPASTIRRWAAEGRLRAVLRIGRKHYYREADVLNCEAAIYQGQVDR